LIFFSVAALQFLRAWSHTRVYAPGARKNCALLQKKISAHYSTSYSTPALSLDAGQFGFDLPFAHFSSYLVQVGRKSRLGVLVHMSRGFRPSWAK